MVLDALRYSGMALTMVTDTTSYTCCDTNFFMANKCFELYLVWSGHICGYRHLVVYVLPHTDSCQTRDHVLKQKEEISIGRKEEIFYDEGDEVLEQVARESCEYSIPGRLKARLEGPLGILTWSGNLAHGSKLELEGFQFSFQPKPLLEFMI